MGVQRLQSVENAFRVLEAFADEQPAGTSELARRLGMDKNAVQRILVTLAHIGWIHPAVGPATGWQLSSRVVSLAQSYAPDLRSRARPHLEALASSTGETAVLFARDGIRMVVVDSVESTQPLRMTVPLGTEVRLTDGISTDFLAFLDDAERTSLLGERSLAARRVAKVRAQGFYVVTDAFPEVVAVGAPITDHSGQPVGGAYVVGPVGRMTKAFCIDVGNSVASAAAAISPVTPP